MVWFLEQVYPLVKAQVPSAKVMVTGNHANRVLPRAADAIFTGHVEDVRPLIASATASIAPMLAGGGTRLKILEAMALGTPVVTTRKGAEGLDVRPEVDILIGDAPEEFARHVVRLLREPGVRQKLSDAAFQLVKERYDWSVVMPRFLAVAETAMNGATAPGKAPERMDIRAMR
jgi:glycosyltransferase involved in cell wall biosynthesis